MSFVFNFLSNEIYLKLAMLQMTPLVGTFCPQSRSFVYLDQRTKIYFQNENLKTSSLPKLQSLSFRHLILAM